MRKAGATFVLLVFFTCPSLSAERFDDQHLCNPDASNVDKMECMIKFYDDLEVKRLAAEKKRIEGAKEFDRFLNENTTRDGSNEEQSVKSKDGFEKYREEECIGQKIAVDAGSMAGHVKIGCMIKLTEQRIDVISK